MRWVMDMFRWIVEVVLRPLEKKGFVLLPSWLGRRANRIVGLIGVGA